MLMCFLVLWWIFGFLMYCALLAMLDVALIVLIWFRLGFWCDVYDVGVLW